jgi:putative glycerol-1-phosphate prenyltransferase
MPNSVFPHTHFFLSRLTLFLDVLSVDNKNLTHFIVICTLFLINYITNISIQKMLLSKFQKITKCQQKKIAILVDPDKSDDKHLQQLCNNPAFNSIDYLFVGGSLITKGQIDQCITSLRHLTEKPIIIFPGVGNQICSKADGILLLSLISGRNADLLITKHVESAFELKKSGLEILSTSYILIDGGCATSVSYISNTTPIPRNKPAIAAATALAGEMLGHSLVYLDAGSGAENPINPQMIKIIRKTIKSPIIVGGGIRNGETLYEIFEAGADVVVIGNYLESNPNFLSEMAAVKKSFTKKLVKEI